MFWKILFNNLSENVSGTKIHLENAVLFSLLWFKNEATQSYSLRAMGILEKDTFSFLSVSSIFIFN